MDPNFHFNSNALAFSAMQQVSHPFNTQIPPIETTTLSQNAWKQAATKRLPIPPVAQQILNEPFTAPKPLDFSKSLKDQRPVLKKSRLRRQFDPHRDRLDFSHVACPKERRRLRSQDNARLYRDREKQRIIDLEVNIEALKKQNSRLTIESTTLQYKFELLEKYLAQVREVDAQKKLDQILEESTCPRDDFHDNTTQSLRIDEASLNNLECVATIGAGGEIHLSRNSQSSQDSKSKNRNHKNLSIDLSKSSVNTVIENSNVNVTGISNIGEPSASSSAIGEDLKTPSCYGSAEPSPAFTPLDKGKSSGAQFVFPITMQRGIAGAYETDV